MRASDQINWAAQENWLYLEDYYNDLDKLRVSDADLATLYQIVDTSPGITLADLRLAASPVRSDQINIAIARHALYVDLTTHRLTEPGRAAVFRSREMERAYRHRGDHADDLGIEAHPVEMVQGSPIQLGWQALAFASWADGNHACYPGQQSLFPLSLCL